MDKRLVLVVLPIILFATVLAGVGSLPRVHAPGFPGPGTVCLTDASAVPAVPASPCPTTPYTFDSAFPHAPQPGATQLRVGVYVNGSAGLNAFDISLLADHTILKPAGVDLTGTVLL